ncbi:RNA polymerase II transcription regulator recruiting protein [Aureococcus anophagefferens]|nr:RNA polymerase II transcription regulator recruiting protein [Aureococcus anophagefferens]
MEEMLEAMPNVGDITVTRSAVNEGGNNGGFTWTVTFLRDAGSNGYGQFGDCEQRDTVDNLCNSPGDVPKFSGFDASSLTGDCSKTDGVRGGLEWRVAFLENPGSYDGYTYPPGAGNLDSITYDTSNLQGTTPAVVNETEEMERQEATDEVDASGVAATIGRDGSSASLVYDASFGDSYDRETSLMDYLAPGEVFRLGGVGGIYSSPRARPRTATRDQLPYGVSTGALEAALEALLGVGAIEVTTGWELDESSEYGKAMIEFTTAEGDSYTTDPIPYDAVGSAFDETGVYETLVASGAVSARTFQLTNDSSAAAKVTRVHGRGTSATSEVFCEEETGYCSSGGRLDFSGSMESKLEALDELIDAGASRYGPTTRTASPGSFLDDSPASSTNDFALSLSANSLEDYNGTIGGAGASVTLTQWQAARPTRTARACPVVPSDGSGLQNGLLYYTRVTAINSVGYSLPQATDSAMKPVATPARRRALRRVSAGNIQGYGTPQSTAPSSAAPYEESGAPSDVELGITSDSMLTIGHAYPPDGGDDDVSSYRDVDGSGWFYSGEPAYALSIGGVGNLSACAEWEHPCSTRRRSECLAWDAEECEVDEQNDLFMSEFLDVADGVTGTRKTGVANAPSGYAYSLPAMLADGAYLAGGVVATVVDDVVQGSAATGIVSVATRACPAASASQRATSGSELGAARAWRAMARGLKRVVLPFFRGRPATDLGGDRWRTAGAPRRTS